MSNEKKSAVALAPSFLCSPPPHTSIPPMYEKINPYIPPGILYRPRTTAASSPPTKNKNRNKKISSGATPATPALLTGVRKTLRLPRRWPTQETILRGEEGGPPSMLGTTTTWTTTTTTTRTTTKLPWPTRGWKQAARENATENAVRVQAVGGRRAAAIYGKENSTKVARGGGGGGGEIRCTRE